MISSSSARASSRDKRGSSGTVSLLPAVAGPSHWRTEPFDTHAALGELRADPLLPGPYPRVGPLAPVGAVGDPPEDVARVWADEELFLAPPAHGIRHTLLVTKMSFPGQHQGHLDVRGFDAADPLELVVGLALPEDLPDGHAATAAMRRPGC